MIAGTIQNVKNFFLKRTIAYNKVFAKESPYTHDVLSDLAKFCRAYETSFHPNPHVQAALEGRREVWLRIQEHLNLTSDQIYALHRGKEIKSE